MICAAVPWADKVHLHVSDEGTRADLATLTRYASGAHIYTCGPDAYMAAVMDAAEKNGFPEEARHLEYFAVPEQPDYENHPFTLLLNDGRSVAVAADQSASDALIAAGVHVDVKCADGLCGVCKCGVLTGPWNTAISCFPRRSARPRSSCAKAARQRRVGHSKSTFRSSARFLRQEARSARVAADHNPIQRCHKTRSPMCRPL